LGSFKALGFYPDCTQALLVAGRLKPFVFGPAENTLMAEVEAEVRQRGGARGGGCIAEMREGGGRQRQGRGWGVGVSWQKWR